MANPEHRQIFESGKAAWQQWRESYPDVEPDLRGVSLRGQNLSLMNFRRTDLSGAQLWQVDLGAANLAGAKLIGAALYQADLSGANLVKADLSRAQLGEAKLWLARLYRARLTMANFTGANLRQANLRRANLCQANLQRSDLREADLRLANLTRANLTNANLVGAKFQRASLVDCQIYGISAWGVQLEGATQLNLVITPQDEPTITVDNLEVAQFIYLLLHNEKIRHVIDTITSKVVLILGRFTPERKAVLDAIREALRQRDLLPVLFDFPPPASRDLTETITILARMARFIIADITDAKSIPQELTAIVPHLPSVPIQPLLESSSSEYGMFEHFKRYPWVLETYQYSNLDELLHSLEDKVIVPAEAKAKELRKTVS